MMSNTDLDTDLDTDLELPCSGVASPEYASTYFAGSQQEMPRTPDLGARSYFQTIFRTIAGFTLVMGTVMRLTRGSNFESLKIEGAINEYMSVARTHMHRRAMEGSADTSIDISAYEGIDQTLLSFLSKSSYAREKVIEMVIDLYTSPSSPYDLLTDKLDNAIEAIDLVEMDGEPIQVKGYPFLFVGSVGEIVIHCFH